MPHDSNLLNALRRLDKALGAVETATKRLGETERLDAARDAETTLLAEDRARLAEELDANSARATALENANREVVRRIDVAMDTIRTVLATAQDK
jgi:hypothetical protein